MKLAIANLTNGGMSGGYVKYLRHLLPRIAADRRVDCLDVFLPDGLDRFIPGLPATATIHSWPSEEAGTGWTDFSRLRTRISYATPDVVFIPTARWMDFGATPVVVMVRNMEPFLGAHAGNPPLEYLRNIARVYAARRACQRATKVIAVSQFVAQFVTDSLKVAAGKSVTIYHGTEPAAPAQLPKALAEAPAPREFLFTAGSLRPARGLEDVIQALASLRQQGWCPRLLIAGTASPTTASYSRQMRALAARLNVADQLVWLGQLSDAEMSWCFTHCWAFLMTSRAEACPNVVLEAMQHGCVSVSTDQMPMPEFYRDAACYYRGGDPGALARQLLGLRASGNGAQARLSSAARSRAACFDWDRTAEATVSCLEEAARSGWPASRNAA